jgi:hypothetical protein
MPPATGVHAKMNWHTRWVAGYQEARLYESPECLNLCEAATATQWGLIDRATAHHPGYQQAKSGMSDSLRSCILPET